jgi:hypothetical protein
MSYEVQDAEARLTEASLLVSRAETALAEEYLLRLGAGRQTWEAQKMAEITHMPALRQAQLYYEIALARLRRA